MTLTDALELWVAEAERMHDGPAKGLVVTRDLLAHLVREQGRATPLVRGLAAVEAASEVPAGTGLPSLEEMVEISGPDRVCVYVGAEVGAGGVPAGHDAAMPVFFVPVPPASVSDGSQLEMYNRMRWYGLGPDEALAGSRP